MKTEIKSFDEYLDDFEAEGPSEEDILISDTGPLGSLYSVGVKGGKYIGTFKDMEEVDKAIREYMEKAKMWPNVWYIDDHGGHQLHKMSEAAIDNLVDVTLDNKDGTLTLPPVEDPSSSKAALSGKDPKYPFDPNPGEITDNRVEEYLELLRGKRQAKGQEKLWYEEAVRIMEEEYPGIKDAARVFGSEEGGFLAVDLDTGKTSVAEVKKYKMDKTYDVITPESASRGDTAEDGFIYENQEFDSLKDMANEIRNEGPVEASDSNIRPHTWYIQSDPDVDYQDGSETRYSWHPADLTEKEANKLWDLISGKKEFIIKDWAGNELFDGETFETFEDAWAFLMEKFPDADDEDLAEYEVVKASNEKRFLPDMEWSEGEGDPAEDMGEPVKAPSKNPVIDIQGYKFEVEITDGYHCKMRKEGEDRWGIPLHIAQLTPEQTKQLRDQGVLIKPKGGGGAYFVTSAFKEPMVIISLEGGKEPTQEQIRSIEKALDAGASTWGQYQIGIASDGLSLHGIDSLSGFKYIDKAIAQVSELLMGMGYTVTGVSNVFEGGDEVTSALGKDEKAELLEKIAAVQHDAWTAWSKAVASEVKEERRARWQEAWVPYDQLDEGVKDLDREWAEEVMEVIEPYLGEAQQAKEMITKVDSARYPELAKALSSTEILAGSKRRKKKVKKASKRKAKRTKASPDHKVKYPKLSRVRAEMDKEVEAAEEIEATGEMGKRDLEPGGEWYGTRLFLEWACEELGLECLGVYPFDVYQGPYAKFPGGKIWLNMEAGPGAVLVNRGGLARDGGTFEEEFVGEPPEGWVEDREDLAGPHGNA